MTATFDFAPVLFDEISSDVTLLAILTGGVYLEKNLPRLRLSNSEGGTSAAYDSDGYLKPVLTLRGRAATRDNQLSDPSAQYQSVRQVVELYFYMDGDGDVATLESAAARVYALLHEQALSEGYCRLFNPLAAMREPELADAHLLRHDYEIFAAIAV